MKPVFKEIPQGQERAPNHQSRLLKRRRREEGGSHAWWSMKIPCLVVNEDPLLGGQWKSLAWWSMKDPMLGGQWKSLAWWSMKDPMLGGQWEEKKKVPCYLFPLPLEQLYLILHFILFFYLLTLNFYFTMVLGHHLHLLFLSSAYKSWPQNLMSQVHPTSIVNSILLKIFPLFLESMASRMVTSYGPQAAQADEEPPSESSLDLTLT